MKIKLELFGASREFSNKDHLEFEIKEKIEIKDFRKELINYLDKNFKSSLLKLPLFKAIKSLIILIL